MNWDEDALLAHLDLVAVSIAADIVPITGENRILMELGLRQINQSPSPGLEALMQVSGFKPEPDGKYQLKGDRLVFGLGPRINAAGRIGHGSGAVELLTSNTLDEALEKASRMDDQNGERKELDKSITIEALSMISGDPEKQGAYTSVLFQAHWHKGVIGIVASRCIEQYYKPTIVLTESNGKLTGSGRSIFGFDLYAALDACREHLIQFGGHYFAAGLTLYPEQLDGFVKAFEAQARMRLQPDDLQARVVLDAELPLGQINQRLFQQIQRLGPFGPQNMNPLFVAFGVRDNGFSRLLDSKSGGAGHIKFSLSHPDLVYEGRPYALDGIGFGLAGYWPLVVSGEPFDIAFHLEENTFRERTTLQLTVKEIRPHQTENS
jgi:single-stranded-DNA-specific exonuclease